MNNVDVATTQREALAKAHREDREYIARLLQCKQKLQELQLLEQKYEQKQRGLRRVPSNVLRDGELIRHKILKCGDHPIEFNYDKGKGFNVMGLRSDTLNKLTTTLYKLMRPDRGSTNNAWDECEVKRDGVWGSMEHLPLLPLE